MDFILSPTLGINEKIAGNPEILNFGLGQSPFPVIPSMVEALKQNAHQKDYLNVQGLKELREQIAQFHEEIDGYSFEEDDIIIGPGSKELLFSLLFIEEADVYIPTPCWVTYPPQCQMLGRKAILIHCDPENSWRLTPDLLEGALKENSTSSSKFLILNFPNNPCGYTYSSNEIKDLSSVCDKYDVTIISDEIYGQITHNGSHTSPVSFTENAIISSGISKWAGAGGWRLGYMAFTGKNNHLVKKMKRMVSETYTSVSAPIQYASISAFEQSDEVAEYLMKVRKSLGLIAVEIESGLKDIQGVTLSDMQGGFYFFLDMTKNKGKLATKGITNSSSLANYLLENHYIAGLPGSSFGRETTELSMRFSFVDFNGGDLLDYSIGDINQNTIQKHCHRVIAGVQELRSVLM